MTAESDYQAVAKPIRAAAVARVLGVGYRYLVTLREKGYIKQSEYGLFSIPDAVQGYLRFLRERRQPTKQQAAVGLTEWQRRKLELDVKQRQGKLLPIELLDETMQSLVAETVSLLESQPGRLANELAGISEPAVIREILLDDNRRIRAALAVHLERRAEALRAVQALDSDDGTSAEAESVAMGGGEQDLPGGEHGTGPLPGEEDAVLQADAGRVRGPSLPKGRGRNGHADGKNGVVPKRDRAQAR